jgi:hypothetical protein
MPKGLDLASFFAEWCYFSFNWAKLHHQHTLKVDEYGYELCSWWDDGFQANMAQASSGVPSQTDIWGKKVSAEKGTKVQAHHAAKYVNPAWVRIGNY